MFLWTAQTTTVKTSLTCNKIHHLQDLDPPGPAIWQRDLGVDHQTGGEPTARLREEGAPHDMWSDKLKRSVQEEVQFRTREGVQQPECHQRREEKQIALRWSHDQTTRRPTTKSYFHSKAARNKAARKT